MLLLEHLFMKNNILVCSTAVVIALLSSCVKQQPPPLYQEYEVDYEITDDTTTLSAVFKVGNEKGPYAKLVDNQRITANGIPSNTTLTFAVTYAVGWGFHGSPDIDLVFRKDDKTLNNSVKLSDAGNIAFSATNDTIIYRNKPLVIHWSGSPNQAEDKMYAALMSGPGVYLYGQNESLSVATQADSAVWNEDYMRSRLPGKYKIYLVRERTLPLVQADGSAGGKKIIRTTIYRWVEIR